MGFQSTWRLVSRGVRRRTFRRFHRTPEHRWDMLKNMLDSLIRHSRIETTLAKAKELQQYAEEVVHFARKDTPEADKIVESMLRTPQARHKLYEVVVPRYAERKFYVTRVFNQYKFRLRDSAPMAYIEFVDRPGEIRPANPVGWDRSKFVWEEMQKNRDNFRRYFSEARKRGLLTESGVLLSEIGHLAPQVNPYEWQVDDGEESYVPLGGSKELGQQVEDGEAKGQKMIPGPSRGLEPFFVNLPYGHERNLSDRRLRKQFKP